jgi:acid phosphatase (class A)
MKVRYLILVIVALSACATPEIKKQNQPNPQTSFAYHLDGAPKAGSLEDEKDYQTLLSLQESRTEEDCARGSTEVKITLGSFYGPPYGPLTAKEVAEYSHLFIVLSKDAWPLINQTKENFKRVRPFNAHSDLKPCVKKETSFSYPSAHAAISAYYKHVLEIIFPERKDAIKQRAEQIAHDRNLVGVHYPSDVRDGKKLGDQIYAYLAKDENFKKLITAGAGSEIQMAPGSPTGSDLPKAKATPSKP